MDLLLDATIRVSLIVLLALAATALLKKQSAAVRHWLLAAAFLCALLVPVLAMVVPSWSVPLDVVSSRLKPAPTTMQIRTTTESSITVATPLPIVSGGAATGGSAVGAGFSRLDTVASLLVAAWLAGTIISISILLVGLGRLTWLTRHARVVRDGIWADVAADLSRTYGLRRTVRLLQTEHPALLMTWGGLRPQVILPAGAHGWPADRIRVVLCHELAHIRRGDWAVQLTAELVRSMYWFNPLLWVACRRLRQEGEQACDDAVLQQGIEGREYAWQLLTIARAFRDHGRTWLPAAAMARPSSLERRVGAMLDSRLNREPATRWACAAAVVALVGVTIPIAAAQTGPASLTGTIYDPAGGVVANAKLVLAGSERSIILVETISDANGRFEFERIPAGTYRLDAWSGGDPHTFRGASSPVPNVVALSRTAEEMTLSAGQHLERDVTLELGPLDSISSSVWDAATGETVVARGRAGWPENWSCLPGSLAFCGPPSLLEEFERDLQDAGRMPMAVHLPRQVSRPSLQYPSSLRDTGIEGQVALEGRIGTDGFFSHVRVISSPHPELARAAIEAAAGARWEPARLRGVLVEVPIRLTFDVNVR